jgi:uncharacterized protein (TIGR02246 family)
LEVLNVNRHEELMIRLEIESLNAEFAYLIDHDRSDEVADLFTEDGVYRRSTGEASSGREAIRRSYRIRADQGQRTARHIFSNLRLTMKNERLAHGTVILTLFAHDGTPPLPADPMLVADYDDVYVLCDDGRWRYRERTVTWLFRRAGARSPLQLGAEGKARPGYGDDTASATAAGLDVPTLGLAEEKDAIRETMARYCQALDAGDYDRVAALFTEDGEWTTDYDRAVGPASIEAMLTRNVPRTGEGPRRKHYVANSVTDVNGLEATAVSNYLIIRESENGLIPVMCGTYKDRFRKQGGQWRFARKELIHDIAGDMALKNGK